MPVQAVLHVNAHENLHLFARVFTSGMIFGSLYLVRTWLSYAPALSLLPAFRTLDLTPHSAGQQQPARPPRVGGAAAAAGADRGGPDGGAEGAARGRSGGQQPESGLRKADHS